MKKRKGLAFLMAAVMLVTAPTGVIMASDVDTSYEEEAIIVEDEASVVNTGSEEEEVESSSLREDAIEGESEQVTNTDEAVSEETSDATVVGESVQDSEATEEGEAVLSALEIENIETVDEDEISISTVSIQDDEDGIMTASMDIPSDAYTYNGHSYKWYSTISTFSDAEAACEALGGHLATMDSELENTMVTSYLESLSEKPDVMIGLYDAAGSAGTWDTWVTGEAVTFENWGPNQPDYSYQTVCILCATANSTWGWVAGEWDNGNDGDYTYLCEWDGVNNTSTTISFEEDYIETYYGQEIQLGVTVTNTESIENALDVTWTVIPDAGLEIDDTASVVGNDTMAVVSVLARTTSRTTSSGVSAFLYKVTATTKDNVSDSIYVIVGTPTITLEPDEFTYTGEECKPVITVTNPDGETLIEGDDYELVGYENNIDVGKASVTIRYLESEYEQTETFDILPGEVENFAIENHVGWVRLTWDELEGNIDGYKITYWPTDDEDEKLSVTITDSSTVYKDIEDLTRGQMYTFQIRGYKNVESEEDGEMETLYGEKVEKTTTMLNYPLATDCWGFVNPSGMTIRAKYFNKYFSLATACSLSKYRENKGHGGLCFGMCVSAVTSWFYDDPSVQGTSLYDVKNVLDAQVSGLMDSIYYAHAYEAIDGSYIPCPTSVSIDCLVEYVEEYLWSGGNPVLIKMNKMSDDTVSSSHSILAIDVWDDVENNATQLKVYDPNYPGEDKYIILNKGDDGNYVSWTYSSGSNLWGEISQQVSDIIPDSGTWYRLGFNTDVTTDVSLQSSNIDTLPSGNFYENLDRVMFIFDNVQLDILKGALNFGLALDGYSNASESSDDTESDDSGAYWISKQDSYALSDIPAGASLSFSSDYHTITIEPEDTSNLVIRLSDTSENAVEVTSDNDSSVKVSFRTYTGSDENDVQIVTETYTVSLAAGQTAVLTLTDSGTVVTGVTSLTAIRSFQSGFDDDDPDVLTETTLEEVEIDSSCSYLVTVPDTSTGEMKLLADSDGDGTWSDMTEIAVGTSYSDGTEIYTVTASDEIDHTVSMSGLESASVTSLTIPDTVTIDGIDYKVTAIAASAFADCTNLTTVTVGENVISVGNSAFSNCTNLKTVTIGKNVTAIGSKAFINCTSLKKVKGCEAVTIIGSSAFSGCTALTSVEGMTKLTAIGSKAFYKCTKLTAIGKKSSTVTLASVGTIGKKAFYGCKALKKINLTSKTLTSIGASAFQGCTALKSFTAKSTKLKSIGKKAFYGDKKLATISLKTKKLTKSSVKANAFKGIKSTCTFKVPSAKVLSYRKIFKAKGAGSKIKVKKL